MSQVPLRLIRYEVEAWLENAKSPVQRSMTILLCSSGRRPSKSERKYNLSAYKPHAIPDYAAYIRLNGTTDGFTSQVVSHLPSYSVKKCLAHQKVHLGRT